MGYVSENLMPDEKIIYKGEISFISTILPFCIFFLLFLCFFIPSVYLLKYNMEYSFYSVFIFLLFCIPASIVFGLFSFLSFFDFIDYFTYEFIMTNKRIIGKGGFIRHFSFEQYLDKIDSLEVEQGILGRIFKYGYIGYNTSGSKNGMGRIKNPIQLKNKINNYIFENFKK